MKRSLTLAIGGVVASALSVVLLAFGGTGSEAALSRIRDPVAYHRASYSAYYGVDMETAEREIALSPVVAEFDRLITESFPAEYGGLWIEHDPKFGVVVALTDGDIKASFESLIPQALVDLVTPQIVERSAAQLRKIAAEIEPAIPRGIRYNLNIDIKANVVVIQVLAMDATETRQALVGKSGVEIIEVSDLGGADANVRIAP